MTTFHATQAFEVPVVQQHLGGRRIEAQRLSDFWRQAGDFAQQHGCYIFSLRAGRGEKPWYVGKASRQSFTAECFALHKLNVYNEILGDRIGRPRLRFLIPEHVRGPWPMSAIDEVEEFLIGYAASRNKALANKRRLPNQTWSIQGVIAGAPGAPTAEASSFKRLMGI